jgi:hypothetical protein
MLKGLFAACFWSNKEAHVRGNSHGGIFRRLARTSAFVVLGELAS